MRKIRNLWMLAMSTGTLLCGCDVKDTIYNTNHPDKGEMSITTRWDAIGEGISKPSLYTIEAEGNRYETDSDTYTLPELFLPGNYSLRVYNKVNEIEVAHGVATVHKVSNMQGQDDVIEPLPGWLFTGKEAAVEVVKDSRIDVTIAMLQQVRQLTLMVKPEGSSANKIQSVTGSLSGVAAAWDVDTDRPTADPARVNLTFTRITEGENAGSWQATVRLLGITGASQKFNGTIVYEKENPNAMESDLTEKLKAFNTDKRTPLTLGGQVELPAEAGFTATIIGWEVISSSGVAN